MNSYAQNKDKKNTSLNNEAQNDSFVAAREYYDVTLKRQREVIRQDIKNALEKGDGEIILSVNPYDKITEELENLGWSVQCYEENNKDRYYMTLDYDEENDEDEEIPLDANFMTPSAYYHAVIKIQRRVIKEEIAIAMEKGEDSVDISITPCTGIIKELEEAGWLVDDYEPEDKPVTYIWFYESDFEKLNSETSKENKK